MQRVVQIKILKGVKVWILRIDSLQLHLNVISHRHWLPSYWSLALDVLGRDWSVVLLNLSHLISKHLLCSCIIPGWSRLQDFVWGTGFELASVAHIESHHLTVERRLVLILETRLDNSSFLLCNLVPRESVDWILKILLNSAFALKPSRDTVIVLLRHTLPLLFLASLFYLVLLLWTLMNVAVVSTHSCNSERLNLHLVRIRLHWMRSVSMLR